MTMTKVPEYPRPHNVLYAWGMSAEPSAETKTTICPISQYSETLGIINSYKSHPESAAFTEVKSAVCYPTSRINNFFAELRVELTKGALVTDKIIGFRFATMQIHTSFLTPSEAADEISTLDLEEILELQHETTNRSTNPLYNTVDLLDGKSNAFLDMPTDQIELDTDLEIEGVTFVLSKYFDCLHYYTNGPQLRKITTKLKWHTLTVNNPHKTITFGQQSNTKFMNPYAFNGVMVHVPANAAAEQFGKVGDTTADLIHAQFQFQYRYNEFNHEFNHAKQ